MPTLNTQDLTGAALDWAVATAEGRDDVRIAEWSAYLGGGHYIVLDKRWNVHTPGSDQYMPSKRWNDAGPIIDRERIALEPGGDGWQALFKEFFSTDLRLRLCRAMNGPTPLIAAMRAYVAAKLGATVEIPEELAL